MEQKEFVELYAELCNVIDKEMGKLSGHVIAEEIPSTSPEARTCANRVLEVLAKYGIELQP